MRSKTDISTAKSSIEALFDIVSGMELAAYDRLNPLYPDKPDFRDPLSFYIPDEDVECLLTDSALVKALEDAGLRGFVNYVKSFEEMRGMAKQMGSGSSIDQDLLKKVRLIDSALWCALSEEFIGGVIALLNRLPAGFPAEDALTEHSKLTDKPEQTRKEREIIHWSRDAVIKKLDIGADANRIGSDMGIYRRENGMLYVRIMIDGKLIRRSLETRNKTEALWKTRSVIEAALEGQKAKEVPTLAEFSQTYLEYSKRRHRKSTHEDYVRKMRKLNSRFGSLRLDQIDKPKIGAYSRTRLKEVDPKTVNRDLSLLSSIMEYALELDYIQENPVRKVKKLTESPGRERYLEPGEIIQLLDACKVLSERKDAGHNPILYEIVLTALLTGLRKGNLQKLKWSQVNLKTGLITIPAGEHKNRKPLYLPISEHLRKVLADLRDRFPHSTYVFSKPDGTSYGDWKRSFNTACEKAGFEDVRFHDLRHTHGTLLNMLDANQYTIMSLMGHRTLKASQGYVHTPPEKAKETSNALGEYLRGILDGSD